MSAPINNPQFIEDLKNLQISQRTLAHKWGISKTRVQQLRKNIDDLDIPRPSGTYPGVSSTKDFDNNITANVTSNKRMTKQDVADWLESIGESPDTYDISIGFSEMRDSDGNVICIWNKIKGRPKYSNTVNIPSAEALAARIEPIRPAATTKHTGLPRVICLSDFQVGKVNPSNENGTLELDERFNSILAKLAAMVEREHPSQLVIADVGDCIENITSSAPNQIATNDCTPDVQLWHWQTLFTRAIATLAPYASRTDIIGVPSNHAEVRNEKGQVGTGDYGLSTLHAIEDAYNLLAPSPTLKFHYPAAPGEPCTGIQIAGSYNVFFHGHHAKRPSNVSQWVANQAAGRSILSEADVCVHGHFHHRGYTWTRGREIISCPTMDGGSDWFEHTSGEYSNPAIATYQIVGRYSHMLEWVEAEDA